MQIQKLQWSFLLFFVFTISNLFGQSKDPFIPYVNDAGQLIHSRPTDGQPLPENLLMACPSTNNLQTPMNQNNGQRGIMFDIVALSNITINCFETNLAAGTTPIAIYYKVGTHVGFQNNAAAWTLLGTAPSVTSLGNNVNTPIPLNINIPVTAQCTVAFYITRTQGTGPIINYTNGTATGALLSADANMRILQGTGKDYPFGASFQPRNFNGRVFYTTNGPGGGPGNVNGPTAVCAGSSNTYTLSTTGWTSYNWTVPAGTTIVSGQNTGSITVLSGPNSGNVCVTPSGPCGPAPQVCLPVSQAPNPSSTITQTNVACFGGNTGSATINPSPAGAYTYQWSPSGGNGQTANGLTAGVYTVTATNSGNCRTIQTVTITQPPTGVSTSSLPTNVLCNGQTNGSIFLTVNGAVNPIGYSWSNGAITQNLSNIAAGTYTVTVTDGSGCTSTRTTTVSQPSVLSSTVNPINIGCNGSFSGAIDLTPTGGTTGYTYLWNTGSGSQDLGSLGAGTYSVTVTDANGCTTSNAVTLTQPAALTTSTTQVIPQTCSYNGSVNINVSGGVTNYTYNWSNGANTQNISGLNPGTYTVTITDANGCTISNGPNNIINIAPPTVTLNSITNVTCNGLLNGAVNINTQGGTPQYLYQWSNGATTQNLTGIAAGSYNVTVTDSLGCILNLSSLNVTQPNQLVAVDAVTDLRCFNDNSGVMNVNPSGGTSPYNYLWNVGLTAQNLTSAPAGAYQVTITDANGCITTVSDTINQPTLLQTSTALVIPQTCSYNGSVDINVSGGVTNYTYNWSNGANTQNISGLNPGSYTVTITDANGCTITNGPNTIVNIAPPTVTLNSTTNVSCNGFLDGSISISAAGGTPQYVYLWSNGSTTQNLSGIAAGIYNVSVTDSLGCVLNLNAISVTEPAVLVSSNLVSDLLCFNDNSGTYNTSSNGGTSPYNYIWSNGATTQNLSGLAAGIYSVTINDSNGCINTIVDTILQPTALQTSTSLIIPQTCTYDGSIDINISGGTTGYLFNWSNGNTTEDISGLQPGNYDLTITDANGCTITNGPNTINNVAAQTVSLASTVNVSCNGLSNGSADIIVVGGTPQYVFNWNNGQTTEDISGLAAGNYDVTITDSLGCVSVITNIQISEPQILSSSNTQVDVLCNGGNNASIDLTVQGGTVNYSFVWSNGSTTEDLSAIVVGNYDVTITDANGCISTSSATITEPTALQTSTALIIPQTCSYDGSIDVNVSGGVSGYIFNWSNGASTEDITGLLSGTYDLTITDANGCTISNLSNTVNLIGSQTANTNQITAVTCNGFVDGAIDITVSGGSLPYNFLWSNGSTNEDQVNLTAGNYDVTITDSLGCIVAINAINVTEPNLLTVSNTPTDLLCNGAANGSIILSIQGGTTPYSYLWSNGATTQNISNLSGSTNDVTVTDANGCITNQLAISIFEPTAILLTNISVIDASCGVNDGTINLDVNGGTGVYAYSWTNGSSTEDINGLGGGTYTLIVTDANNCTVTTQAIQVNASPAVYISTTATNELCAQPGTGSVEALTTGGTSPFNYIWSNGETTEDISNLNAGSYTVTITDADNCTFTSSINILTPFVPTLSSGMMPTMAGDTSVYFGDTHSLLGGVNQTTQNVTYGWTFNGPGNPNFTNPTGIQTNIDPDTDGQYTFVISATSGDGCLSTDTIYVFVERLNPQIPNAFTPNGDGINDIFQVVDLDKELINEFKIYDKWGQLVFDDITKGFWDGTFNGEMQNRDVYIYVIGWRSSNRNEAEIKRGAITLIR